MSTIYLLSPDSKLSRSGGRLIVRKGDAVVSSQPLQTTEAVIIGARASVSKRLLSFLSVNGCRVYRLDRSGNISEYSAATQSEKRLRPAPPRPPRRKRSSSRKSSFMLKVAGLATATLAAGCIVHQLTSAKEQLNSSDGRDFDAVFDLL